MVAWHHLLYSTLIKPSQLLDIAAYCFSYFVLFIFFSQSGRSQVYLWGFCTLCNGLVWMKCFSNGVSINWPLLHYTRLLSNTLFLNNSNSPLRRLKFFDGDTYWISENINNILKPLDELWCPDNVRTFRTFFLSLIRLNIREKRLQFYLNVVYNVYCKFRMLAISKSVFYLYWTCDCKSFQFFKSSS